MAKGKPAKKGAAANRCPSLDALRQKIDELDAKLLETINERAKYAREIGHIKIEAGISAYAPSREDEIFKRVLATNPGPVSDRCLRAIFREIISSSRALEKELRVAYLGPAYSYSHLAAIHRFGQAVELVPVAAIAAVFEEVNSGHANFGLVPVENSTDGRVADTLDMFTRVPAKICGEIQLRIHHNLLGKCNRGEVEEVYSKPQALSQCRNWLAKHLPAARMIEVTSTSTAAQLAHDKPGAAAIASIQAGIQHGLDVLAADIEDQQGNVTRFAVIGAETGPRTAKDSCSVMFEVQHRPGSLADAMTVFKRHKLNLTWIESFPIARPEGGYMFFVELEGHEEEPRVKKAIAQLAHRAVRLDVLGSYAKLPPVD